MPDRHMTTKCQPQPQLGIRQTRAGRRANHGQDEAPVSTVSSDSLAPFANRAGDVITCALVVLSRSNTSPEVQFEACAWRSGLCDGSGGPKRASCLAWTGEEGDGHVVVSFTALRSAASIPSTCIASSGTEISRTAYRRRRERLLVAADALQHQAKS